MITTIIATIIINIITTIGIIITMVIIITMIIIMAMAIAERSDNNNDGDSRAK